MTFDQVVKRLDTQMAPSCEAAAKMLRRAAEIVTEEMWAEVQDAAGLDREPTDEEIYEEELYESTK